MLNPVITIFNPFYVLLVTNHIEFVFNIIICFTKTEILVAHLLQIQVDVSRPLCIMQSYR